MADKLVPVPSIEPERQPREDDALPAIGTWWWVNDKVRWLGCVTRVGSNYVEVHAAEGNQYCRVHLDKLGETLTLEPCAREIIDWEIETRRRHTGELMAKVQEITSQLSITTNTAKALPGGESQALALRGDGQPIADYKKALIKAKDKQLPELFKEIEETNKGMARWMKAALIPLEAQVGQLRPALKRIENRIFSVELYAGLVENVEQITEGEPAPRDTPIHLFQRRAYMDEECLLDYQHGGMEFKNLRQFDKWMAKPRNRDRLLPFPRCVLAMQVRRRDKEREITSLRAFINIALGGERDADKLTFLYLRNGDQLFRLDTAIGFDEQLFPDLDRHVLAQANKEQLYAKDHGHKVITKSQFDAMGAQEAAEERKAKEEYEAELAEFKRQEPEYRRQLAEYEVAMARYKIDRAIYDRAYARADRIARKKTGKGDGTYFEYNPPQAEDVGVTYPEEPKRPNGPREPWLRHVSRYSEDYRPWNKDNVYFDDISETIKEEMDRHNRVVLVLQGLLDRSPVFLPHPPWRLWSDEGFTQALKLVFDDSFALTDGPKPDFEAYRARLNAKLKVGDITVGQEDFWERVEAKRENARLDRSWRSHSRDFRPTRYRPDGNPGPGLHARVVKLGSKGAHFTWDRERSWRSRHDGWGNRRSDHLPCHLTVPLDKLFNVSAYTPGEFKQFFNDPRTRADYLKWAPLLLEAEEWRAGNRKLRHDPDTKSKQAEGETE